MEEDEDQGFFGGLLDLVGDNSEILGAIAGGLIGSQDGTASSTTQPYFIDGQEQGMVDFIDLALQEYDQGPREFFPGETVAALDPNIIAGQNDILGAVDVQRQLGDIGAQAAGELAGGGAGFIEGFDLPDQVGFGIDQGLQDATLNPVMRELENRILPGIQQNATQQGAFGGTRMNNQVGSALSSAAERGTEALARANLEARGQSIRQRAGDIDAMLTGRNQDIRQNQLYNQSLASGITGVNAAMGAVTQPGQTQIDIGRQRTGYEQELIDADVERFNFNRDEPMNALTLLGERLNFASPRGGTTTDTNPANIADIFGGAIAGSQLIGEIFGGSGGNQQAGVVDEEALADAINTALGLPGGGGFSSGGMSLFG